MAFDLLLYLMTLSMFKRLYWYKWQVLFNGHRLVLHCLITVKTWPTVDQNCSYDVMLCNRAFENHHACSEIQESPTFHQVCKRPLNNFANPRYLCTIPSRFLRSWARSPVSSKKQEPLGISWIPIEWKDASIILYNVMIIDFSWQWRWHNFLKLWYQTTHGQHVQIITVPRYWSKHTGKKHQVPQWIETSCNALFVATVEKLLKEWRSARLPQCTVNKTPHSLYHTALCKHSFSVVCHSMLKDWRIFQVLEWQSVKQEHEP